MDQIVTSTEHRPAASVVGFTEPDTSDGMDWQSSSINLADAPQDMSASLLPKADDPPTAKQWEFYRAIITELYINEDHDLKDVIETMRSVYHFKAR